MTLRNLLIGSLLLCIAGCGCNEDSFPPGAGGLINAGVLGVGFEAPRLGVAPNANMVVPIDIVFVLDDGFRFNTDTLGVVPDQPLDRRSRTLAAQRIFDQLRQQVEAKLKAAIDAAVLAGTLPAGFDPATFKDQLDFAFAVARYEDFGGPFSRADTGDPVRDDREARPFILNMPLLRAKWQEGARTFNDAFTDALARPAPGDGNVTKSVAGKDPQSGIEALYQIARGTGFDGNGANGTNESGGPGSDNAQLNPGTTGDVPAIKFGPAGQDPQDPNRPIYPVLDENDQPVTFGGNPVVAAGNIGGVGWRPSSARFVILATDIATVAPTNQAFTPQTTNAPNPPLPQAAKVTSTAGGAAPNGAPRVSVGIPLTAFDADRPAGRPRTGPATATKEGLNPGVVNGYAGVAPLGAHTVEETQAALNELNIEVITLAAPDQIPGHTKPILDGGTNVNGDELDITKAITDVNVYLPTITPWTWLSGICRLTGAVDPVKRTQKDYDQVKMNFDALFLADPVFDPEPATGAPHLALVYNLANVWPYDPAAADRTKGNEALIEDVVVDDLVKRTMEWIKGGYLGASAIGSTMPTLPEPVYDFKLEIMYPETTQLTHTPAGTQTTAGGIVTETFDVTGVNMPVYYDVPGATVPARPRVNFFVPESLAFTAKAEVAETIPLPWSEQVSFRLTGKLIRIDGQTADNAPQVQQIKDMVKARGNGEFFECTTEPGVFGTTPLGLETDDVTFAQGVFEVIVRLDTEPGSGARIVLMENGQLILEDLTLGGIPGEQRAGGDPFPDTRAEPFGCDTEAPAIVVPHEELGSGKLGVLVSQGLVDLTALVTATDNRYSGADLTVTYRNADTTAVIADPANVTLVAPEELQVEVEVTDKAGNRSTATFWVVFPG